MIALSFPLSTLPLFVPSVATELATVFKRTGGMAVLVVVELPTHFGVIKSAGATPGCASLIVVLTGVVFLGLRVCRTIEDSHPQQDLGVDCAKVGSGTDALDEL